MGTILTNESGHRIELGQQIGNRGGEGRVFAIARKPGQVAKIYHTPPDVHTIIKLKWMIANPPREVSTRGRNAVLAWPETLVFDPHGQVVGFVMPFIQSWDLGRLMDPRLRESLQTSSGRTFDWRDVHTIARNLATVVSACHHGGYVIGDLNYNNVRVRSDGSVVLIDTDSFQVRSRANGVEEVHHSTKVFRGFTPPELLGKDLKTTVREPHSDLFVLSALIFQLIQDSHHPFQGVMPGQPAVDPEVLIRNQRYPYDTERNSPDLIPPRGAPPYGRIHPELRQLFQTCFGRGMSRPSLRPDASAWIPALDNARNVIRKCKHGHWYSAHAANAVCFEMSDDQRRICGATASHKPQSGIPLQYVDLLAGTTSITMQPVRAQVFQRSQSASSQAGAPPPTASTSSRPSAVPPVAAGSSRSRSATVLTLLVILAVVLRATGIPTFWDFTDDQPDQIQSSGQNTSETSDINRAVVSEQGSLIATEVDQEPTVDTSQLEGVQNRATATRETQTETVATEIEVEEPTASALGALDFDGTIVFSAWDGQLWSIYTLQAESRQLATVVTGQPMDPRPAISFDGNRIAFLMASLDPGRQLIRIVDATSVAEIATFPLPVGMEVTRIAFAPDEASALLSVNDEHGSHVYRLDLGTGELAQFLAPQSWSLATSSTGRTAYVVPDVGGESIVRANSLGNADIFIGREFRCQTSPVYAPNGDDIAFVFNACDGQVPEVAVWIDGGSLSIAEMQARSSDASIPMAWAPDESSLLLGDCVESGCRLLIVPISSTSTEAQVLFEIPVGVDLVGVLVWAE